MSVNLEIQNNLLVRSILSPALDFTDATDGENNKKTLLNRVKKLTQSERRELMGNLNELSSRIPAPQSVTDAPLREKGLITFVLADDGKQAEGHCFIVSFFLGLMNRVGTRVSSAAVMEKLSETRNLLGTNGYNPHNEIIDVERSLNAQIALLEHQLKEPNPNVNIQPLIEQLDRVVQGFITASEGDWSLPGTFLSFTVELVNFKKLMDVHVPQAKAEVEEATKRINEMILARRTKNLNELSTMLRDSVLPVFESIGIPKVLLMHFQEDLEALSRGKKVSGKSDFSFLEKQFIIPYITCNLEMMKGKLQGIISSFELEQSKTRIQLEIIRSRLTKYQQNCQSVVKQGELDTVKSDIEKLNKELKNDTIICEFIDTSINLINETKVKGWEAVKVVLSVACANFAHSNDELKAIGNFAQHLQLLQEFSNDFTTNKQELAKALEPTLLDGNSDIDLCKRLKQFKSYTGTCFFDSDEQKINFINDHFAYWKFIFGKLKDNKTEELRTAGEKQSEIVEVLTPKRIKKSKQPDAPEPVLIVPESLPVGDSLPPVLNIPTTGNAYLRTIATNLQNNRSNALADFSWYCQVTSDTIPKELVGQVYGNFYWIMKDAGKLCGELADNGDAKDINWGGKVFTSGKINEAVPSIPRSLLNHYRVQAMVEILEGRIRRGANQF
jgi:hypothetical protein